MNFPEFSEITAAKTAALKADIARLGVNLAAIEEQFTRGGGKGGQKINKTANRVVLSYPPLGITVRCQRERKRALNRFIALRELVERVEMAVSPGTSRRFKEIEKIRRNKARRAARRDDV